MRRPICVTSGRCCRFEEFGHRLYVTTMELAKFVYEMSVVIGHSSFVPGPLSVVADRRTAGIASEARPTISLPLLATDTGPKAKDKGQMTKDQPGCPFQVNKLCGVHAIRPFGCRIFFCDETSTQWQHDLYERPPCRPAAGRMRNWGVPYHYVEWAVRTRVGCGRNLQG